MPQLEAWTKTEIRELVVAAVLAVIVGTVFFGTGNVVQLLTGDAGYDDSARSFITDMNSRMEDGHIVSMKLMHYLTARTGFSMVAPIPTPYVYPILMAGPYSGFSIFFGPITLAAQGLINAWFSYIGLSVLYEFATRAAILVLPIAFMFRFIPFTRQLGNTLIALAIGGKVLLPFAVIAVSLLHGEITMPALTVPESAFDKLELEGVTNAFLALCTELPIRMLFRMNETLLALVTCLPISWIPGAFPTCYNIVTSIVYPIMDITFRGAYAGYFAASGLLGEPGADITGGEATGIVYDFLLQVNNFVLITYVDILIIALISYVGIKSISAALGGDYVMSTISRFVR